VPVPAPQWPACDQSHKKGKEKRKKKAAMSPITTPSLKKKRKGRKREETDRCLIFSKNHAVINAPVYSTRPGSHGKKKGKRRKPEA